MDIIYEVIKEVEKRIKIIDVVRCCNGSSMDYIKFYLPFNFCFCIEVTHLLDLYEIYDWSIKQIAVEIVCDIQNEFLDATINKKEN